MTRIRCLLIAVAVGASSGLVPAAAGAAGCVLAGGEATMVTEGLAKFMAEAALKNSITGMGAKPAGKVAMTCNSTSLALTSCTAKQRACR